MSATSDQSKNDAMERLLQEGMASYLDAVYALDRFRIAVTDEAVSVLKDRLPDLASTTGIKECKGTR